MNEFSQKLASDVGIQPAYVKSMEKHGLCFFTWHYSDAVGAQCKQCNNIVWVDPIDNGILNEAKPNQIPSSGEEYQKYHKHKIVRFLESLPACPVCNSTEYDKFINNVSYARFSDGTEFENNAEFELINENPEKVKIWWYEL